MNKRIVSMIVAALMAVLMIVPASVAEEAAVDPIEEIIAQFNEAKSVDPYQVETHPTRVSGWVSMRWVPSTSSPIVATYPARTVLLVRKELPDWLMVENEQTGDIGYIGKAYAVPAGEAQQQKPVEMTLAENGKTDFGTIDINGAFSLQCKLAEGYTIQTVKSASDQLVAIISSEDPSKPVLQLAVAYDEAYANVDRLNDLDDEAFAVLEKTFTDDNPLVEITYSDTGLGTRLMIAKQSDSGFDFLDFMSVYKGYFVECVMVPSANAEERELTDEQIQMCIEFLTELDFVPAGGAEAGIPDELKDAKWIASLIDYDPEANTVTAALVRAFTVPAAEAEALKVGDTLKVGQFEEKIEKLETSEEGLIVINDGLTLSKFDEDYHLYPTGDDDEYTEPYMDLHLTIPDTLTFYDGIDPATGEPLETDTENTAEVFRTMLAEEDIIGFASDNVYVDFDADGNWIAVERFYTPAQ